MEFDGLMTNNRCVKMVKYFTLTCKYVTKLNSNPLQEISVMFRELITARIYFGSISYWGDMKLKYF